MYVYYRSNINNLIKYCGSELPHNRHELWKIWRATNCEKFEWNFRYVIFKRILVIEGWGISCEIALIWISLDFTDDQSTLVQVMAWCHQATSHYLSQCWPRSPSPCGVTRPQWVNFQGRDKLIFWLWLWAPMSSLKHPTPLDVKFHSA